MNILITSAGTRNKVVQYFKKEFDGIGKVIATDTSELAPAIYEADKYYLVPRIDESNYIDAILDICKKEKIDCLFALIDPELSLIAENRERFLKIGTTPLISDYDAVELAFDKYKMYKYLSSNGYKTAKSYIDKDEFYKDLDAGKISFPVFVKPYKGSASININKVGSKEEIDTLFNIYDDLIIQEFLDGQEIGVDVYIDPISKRVVSVFTKEKIKMRAGETDKARSFKDPKLFDLITGLVEKIGYVYMIDIDIFRIDGEYYISEINPRFGGGYPHAYECGVNFPRLVINSMNGIENKNEIGNYNENIYMMKYNEVKIMKK
ncbi:ATP-grasp domain-containing protein [Candidatus Saccharibacteria bacterium]|nr:ATP-grasp domain-containing protein [Candidatus Saccharibacteria bacterium]